MTSYIRLQSCCVVILPVFWLADTRTCWKFLYLGSPVILGQLSVLLLIAFLSSEHISLLVSTLALLCCCVFLELKWWRFFYIVCQKQMLLKLGDKCQIIIDFENSFATGSKTKRATKLLYQFSSVPRRATATSICRRLGRLGKLSTDFV